MAGEISVMDRVVTEYAVGEDGTLQPVRSGAWRVERARGEADLHRRLAGLPTTPSAIARAASTYGPLRLHADALSIFPAGMWDEVALVTAQDGEDDWADVRDWMERGCNGPAPAALSRAMPLLQALAQFPPVLRSYASVLLEGGSRAERVGIAREAEETVGEWEPMAAIGELLNAIDRVAAADGPNVSSSPADEFPAPCGDPGMEWAVETYGAIQDMLGGNREIPEGIDIAGGLSGMLGAVPDLLRPLEAVDDGETAIGRLVSHLRHESLEDWRAAKDETARWVQAVDVQHRLERGELTRADTDALRELVAELLDGATGGLNGPKRPMEMAGLVLPRLRRRLDRRLEELGVWPQPGDRPVGTYARALWAARRELTGERPPQQCAEAGCRNTFPSRRNRRYCDSHRLSRDRERKRNAMRGS